MIKKMSFSAEALAALHSLAQELVPAVQAGDHALLNEKLRDLSASMPENARETMGSLLCMREAAATLEPLSLDLREIGPTPTAVPLCPNEKVAFAASMLLLVGSALGKVFTYNQMKQAGKLFQHVFPVPGMEGTQTAASSDAGLDWHTEHADKPNPPDWLAILCLKNPTQTPTRVSRPKLDALSEASRKILMDAENFAIGSGDCGEEAARPPLEEALNGIRLRFDPLLTEARNPRASGAFAELQSEVEASMEFAAQTPGSIVLIPNRVTTHGRDSFMANFDGEDRWLLRCFVGQGM